MQMLVLHIYAARFNFLFPIRMLSELQCCYLDRLIR
jgi:hypothetical protein